MAEGRIAIRRIVRPFTVFVWVYVLFVLAPTAYIAFSDYYTNYWYNLRFDDYREAAWLALKVDVLFFVCFVGAYFVSTSRSKGGRRAPSPPNHRRLDNSSFGRAIVIPSLRDPRYFHVITSHKFFYRMAVASIFLVWIAFALGGYEKLAQFGQDISKLDYRLIGSDDRSRILTAILQLARRLTLPFCAIYFLLLAAYTKKYSGLFNLAIVFSLFVGILITLDRGPFMLFLVMFAYIFYCTTKNLVKVGAYGLLLLVFMILLGGVLTFIQHNMQDFSFDDVLDTGYQFISNRVVMAPNFVPIELSYGLFDVEADKLWLKHARITALITGEYVGNSQASSLYVGPVGAVADIWRNTGLAGIFFIGIGVGIYFRKIDNLINESNQIMQVAGSFTVITLVFYFLYGTFFSQGVFIQMIFLYFILRRSLPDGKVYSL